MALEGDCLLSMYYSYKRFPGNLGRVCDPVRFPISTDQRSADRKARSPGETCSSGGEWRCDKCEQVFPGRMTRYRQHSKLLCETCCIRFEDAFVETPNIRQKGQKLFREGNLRRGRDRHAVSPISVRNRPSLPSNHRPSYGDTPHGQHQPVRSFSKRAVSGCSKFFYENKQSSDRCSLCVNQMGTTELLWQHNGTVIHCGQDNYVEFSAGDQTTGIYLSFEKRSNELLLVHAICMEKEEGSRPQPLGKDELCFAPNLDCLSDACSDNNPVLCHECTRKGTIFRTAETANQCSPVLGETVTLYAPVCAQERNKFHFVWNCNGVELPSPTPFSFTFKALDACTYLCLARNPSSGNVAYHVVFMVQPMAACSASVPVTDSAVRPEVTPSLNQGVHDHPSALLSNATSSSHSSQLRSRGPGAALAPFGELEEGHFNTVNPSSCVFSPIFQPTNHPAAQPASVCHPPQSQPDSEPEPRPTESYEVKDFLMKQLVDFGAFAHPAFNLISLADSPTCSSSISGIIRLVKQSLPYISEQRTVEHVVRLICQETTLDTTVSIRRCIALTYKLICSLRDDKQNAYHQSIGTRLMQEAPFPPMLLKWSQGTSRSLPRGEPVSLTVTACNADRYDWLFNKVPINGHGGPSCCFSVAPSTCGVYQCSVHNRYGCVRTPPTYITMNDEPTSSSVTEATLETSYNVDTTPGPSTSIACTDVTPVEAETPAFRGRYGVLVVGTTPPSRTVMEQVVPGVPSSDDSRGLILHPTSHLQSAPPQCVPRGLFGPPSPHIHSTTFRPPSSRPP